MVLTRLRRARLPLPARWSLDARRSRAARASLEAQPALHAQPAHRPRSSLRLLPSLLLLPWPSALPPPHVLRRSVAAAAAAAAVLTLSGAQFRVPHSLALSAASPASVSAPGAEGNVYAPAPDPGTLGMIAPVSAPSGPYGLTSPAVLTAAGIPAAAYHAYVAAAGELRRTDPACGVQWSLIAGIGRAESNHGRFGGSTITANGLVTPPILGIRLDGSRPGTARVSDSDNGRFDGDPQVDRAVGPMQFLPATWKVYGGSANPQDMNAAALATARYLCQGGGSLTTRQGQWAAVYRYNHSDSYVSLVLSIADSYASGQVTTFPSRPAGTSTVKDNTPAATPPGKPPSVPDPPAKTPSHPVSPTTPAGHPGKTPAPTPSSGTPSPSGTGSPSPSGTGSPSPSGTGSPSPSGTGTSAPSGCPAPSGSTTPDPTTTDATPTPTPTDSATPAPTSPDATPTCSAAAAVTLEGTATPTSGQP